MLAVDLETIFQHVNQASWAQHVVYLVNKTGVISDLERGVSSELSCRYNGTKVALTPVQIRRV
jgi:hypothetical protein